jgi:hypothetical protein
LVKSIFLILYLAITSALCTSSTAEFTRYYSNEKSINSQSIFENEDGYRLWLRYKQVENTDLLSDYKERLYGGATTACSVFILSPGWHYRIEWKNQINQWNRI